MGARAPAGRCSAAVPTTSVDHRDRGAVTVEAALALCTLAVFLAVAVGSIAAAAASIR